MENQNNSQSNMPEQQPPPHMNQPGAPGVALPNSTAVLVLGILSIVFCWCGGIIGLALGIIALVLSGKAKVLYNENPSAYTLTSFNNLKGGRICAIIGTILSGLYLIYVIIVYFVVGVAFYSMPWDMVQYY